MGGKAGQVRKDMFVWSGISHFKNGLQCNKAIIVYEIDY